MASDARPVWFIYSGMGSQWPAMGRQLMRHVPVFAQSMDACAAALKDVHVDPRALINSDDATVWKNTMHCIVCITAIQVCTSTRDLHESALTRLPSPTCCTASASTPTASSAIRRAKCAAATPTAV